MNNTKINKYIPFKDQKFQMLSVKRRVSKNLPILTESLAYSVSF